MRRLAPLDSLLVVGLTLFAMVGPAAAGPDEPSSKSASDDIPAGHPYKPEVAAASPDATQAMRAFRVPADLKVDLFAAEPLLANPVAFAFDEKGRAFVVETFRLHHGVTDTRGHMDWLDDDLASRTIADRVAKYRKFLGKAADDYGKEHDRLRLVEDRDSDGKADHATVFADGFKNIPDGLAAGVLARKGDVYFTCIPDLWLLRDNDGDGVADVKTSLHHGYGVHTGFLGHDLHGLRFGPDGRLYFSIGDRGLNVKTRDGRTLFLPDTGSVLRCEPDGSGLELFALGLRNPQELAFDDFGNLFTVDNNSDSGDKARLVYVMEGGDSGWTMGWQYIEHPVSRGPWNAEKLWYPAFKGQAAYIVPPLANLADGPSGLTYDPGVTLLPDRYRRHFFLADFRGSSGQSGVRAFSLKPKAAAFALDASEQFLWGLEATDVDFGPDGALYVSDWVEGWGLTGKGRLYKVSDPKADPKPPVAVKLLLAAGFDDRPTGELVKLLKHPDQRVRQGSQFSLADRGEAAIPALRGAAAGKGADERLGRVHAIWALGQVGRRLPKTSASTLDLLVDLLADPDAEIRAQAARTLGDARYLKALARLIDRLGDDPRVVSLAAIALGRLGQPEAVGPLLELLRKNDDADPYLRHAAVMGLAGSNGVDALLNAGGDASSSVRLGVLLALRRLKRPEVARFLVDSDARLVAEAARAVYDSPIEPAIPQLAALAKSGRTDLTEPTWRRVVNACARASLDDDALALAHLASRTDLPVSIRVEAVEILAEWSKPPGRDRVTGLWRPRNPRPESEAAIALGPEMDALVKGPAPVLDAILRAVGALPIGRAGPLLLRVTYDTKQSSRVRVEAIQALERRNDPHLAEAAARLTADAAPALRVEGRRLLAKLSPEQAMPVLIDVLEKATLAEKQGAFSTLATMPEGAADELLAGWLDRLAAGRVAPELELDLLDAARRRQAPAVASKLRDRDAALPKDDPLAPFRVALVGGDAARGGAIVREKAEVSCVRCHKVRGLGGEVGPELSGVAGRGDRSYLLESILTPNRQIAKGFETLLVATSDGQVHTGILKEETATTLRLITAEGRFLTIPKADVEERRRGASAMPDDLTKHLSKAELRDVIEFLSTLK